MNVLSVRGLCKRYGSFALRDVSFDVAPGSITGFIGRNGAGKTTTLKSLLDFVHPDAGEALFFGLVGVGIRIFSLNFGEFGLQGLHFLLTHG